ncbi:Sep1 [Drosophila busckii]|uniref:Septin n=1 Tax=Drosophila busckii TaxID=30019 RepID=A0A0M3QZE1_DROBS|nr:septin-5 isoform X1 [Drosophila busckii]XP_017850228.1 septin-5 isoform X1 [Drosophila busckii]ALC49263.1 Sep1 [Drosophila busckii]
MKQQPPPLPQTQPPTLTQATSAGATAESSSSSNMVAHAICSLNSNNNNSSSSSSVETPKCRPPLYPKPKTPSFDKDRDYIGFATLPEQVHRKSVKRGFEFTLMVVGESGLGKSTLINSLFLGDLYKNRQMPNVEERIEKTTRVEKKTMDIEERGVRLRLTVVDTPGFGDAINCEDSWRVCTQYIDEQFRQYFTDESGLNRRNIQDNRVHCCLYFVPPWGHSLRQMDLDLIRRLHRKVNIVLVIGKADCLNKTEVRKLKERILQDLEDNHIQLYQFPECDSDEDDDFKQQDRELKASIPFAVVGSNTILEVAGKKVRGRQYPWGVVNVEDAEHSDFIKLRTFLISTHMQDLKDTTQDVHYENFRAQCISQISQHALRERGKLKRDSISSTNGFDAAISETDRLLLQKDEEIRRMQDMLTQMQEKLKQTHLMEMKKNDSVIDV